MSERKREEPESQGAPEEEVPSGEAEYGESEPESAEEAPPQGEAERIAELEAEAGELRDQLLRALAEIENLRRRGQREREEAVRYAATALVRDLLPVADNLSRALASVPAGAPRGAPESAPESAPVGASESASVGASVGGEAMKTLFDGLELTERELQAAFQRHHIVKLDPVGERLDPHRHEAMFEVPDPEAVAGTIVQVIQSGYLLHDRLLRPARVGLAKGGPRSREERKEQTEADGGDETPAAEPGSHLDTSA